MTTEPMHQTSSPRRGAPGAAARSASYAAAPHGAAFTHVTRTTAVR